MRSLFSVVLNRKVGKVWKQKKKKKKELYRIVNHQISNLSLQQFTASARKHTEYLYLVVHKTSLQSVQAKKELYRIGDGQISNLSLQQFTASARKHTEYLYPVVHKTSMQSVQAKKKKKLKESESTIVHLHLVVFLCFHLLQTLVQFLD